VPQHTRPLPQRILRLAVVLALSASVLYAVVTTIHWPIVGDSPLLHYTTFLLDHGKQPYTQIIEMDLPGTYAIEWTARHVLGPGPLAWRFADFLLIALCWLSMIAITLTPKPKPPRLLDPGPWALGPDWLPGFFAGAMFALIHFRDGPTHTGQRDLMMTALLLPALAFLFHALQPLQKSVILSEGPERATRVEGPQPKDPETISRAANANTVLTAYPALATTLFFLTGLFLGAATTVKPNAIFFALAFAAIALFHLHRNKQPILTPFFLLFDGFILPLAAMALWLHHHHAFRAFFDTMTGLAAYHASLGRHSLPVLVIGSFPNVMLAVAIPAVPLFFVQKPWRHLPGQLLIAATLLGCLSYILQGKGFPYHRYPTEAFLFLLIATLAFQPLQNPVTSAAATSTKGTLDPGPWALNPRFLTTYPALATILLGAFFLAPISAHIAGHFDWRDQEFNNQLTTDLTTLSHNHLAALQNQVQCIDDTAGCINTLYNLQLVQATGYLYSCYAFQSKPSPYQDRYRLAFLTAVQQADPRILVVSDQDCFTLSPTFDRLNRWPQFIAYIAQNYTLFKQYTPPHKVGWWRHPSEPFSYRIYLHK
jgi:hypothetical protein